MPPQCEKPWLRCRRGRRCQEFWREECRSTQYTSRKDSSIFIGFPAAVAAPLTKLHDMEQPGLASWLAVSFGRARKWKRLCEFKTGDSPGLAWQRELLPERAHSWVQLRRRDSRRIVFPSGRRRSSERGREMELWVYLRVQTHTYTCTVHCIPSPVPYLFCLRSNNTRPCL